MIWDVVIIGGGPAGNFSGYLSASFGLKTVILEEHSNMGEPIHCLGKLSVHAFNEFSLPQNSILSPLKGAYFFSPSGREIKLKKERKDSYILDRIEFDKKLGEMAEKKGVRIIFRAKAFNVHHFKGYSEIYFKEKERINKVKGRIIIDAEGAKRQFLRNLGLYQRPYLVGLQYEVSGIPLRDRECVELYFGEKYSKGFFAWVSPLKDDLIKVGVSVLPQNNPKIYLENLISKIKERTDHFIIEREYGGIIPIYGPYEMFISPNILIVGDASGFNKSTTGGGIYFGLKGSKIAINQIYKYFETGNLNFLKAYPKLIKNSFGKELFFTGLVRRFLNNLSDDDLEEIWDIINNPRVIKKIEERGDTAYQTSIFSAIPSLISNPKGLKSIKFIPLLLKSLLESI